MLGESFRKVTLPTANVGSLYGLEKDLDMHGNQYQTAVSLLFVTYILSEVC
jgi:hypothetical protein